MRTLRRQKKRGEKKTRKNMRKTRIQGRNVFRGGGWDRIREG
jgi:hypothetical protein